MKIKKIIVNSFLLVIALTIVEASPTYVSAASQPWKNGGPGQHFESAENHPLAVMKEGIFTGVADQRISIADLKSNRPSVYRLEENYRILFNDEEIALYDINPNSIIKLIVIEGQVREIILLLRSS